MNLFLYTYRLKKYIFKTQWPITHIVQNLGTKNVIFPKIKKTKKFKLTQGKRSQPGKIAQLEWSHGD